MWIEIVLFRLQRWSIFDSDAIPMFFFITAMRCRCFWPFLTIAIGAIIFAQPSGPIVFRCFFQFATNCAYVRALVVKRRKIHSN